MGNRLSKIATRTGDAGMTGLGDGSRVEKDHLRICAMGDVDELNSEIGVLMTESIPEILAEEFGVLFLQAPGCSLVLSCRLLPATRWFLQRALLPHQARM